MEVLIETYNRLLNEITPLYHRRFYDNFQMIHRLTGIVGARGVGKTTFLLHYLRKNYGDQDKALYISADHLYFSENSLLSLVDQFQKNYAGEIICIDEIHRYNNWNQELKNIYDSYPSIKVIFSGSSSINIVKGKYDLSRRASIQPMNGFSFREYLELQTKTEFPVLSLDDIVKKPATQSKKLSNTPRLLGHFKEYLKSGYYPMFTELNDYEAYQQSLLGIIDKTVYEDISTYYSLKTKNLDSFRKILYFVATSQPGGININKLAKSLKKDHTTTSEYLEMMRECGLLRFLLNDRRGHALIRSAEKIFLNNTNLIYAINNAIQKETNIGVVRELFVINQLEDAGYKTSFSERGDMKYNDYVFEIGGKGKDDRQIKEVQNAYVINDDILVGGDKNIPLYLFGFLS